MTLEVITVILSVLGPAVLGTVSYVYTKQDKRIDMLERLTNEKMSEEKTRQLLNDKLEPVREDLLEIKAKIDKITDHLLK